MNFDIHLQSCMLCFCNFVVLCTTVLQIHQPPCDGSGCTCQVETIKFFVFLVNLRWIFFIRSHISHPIRSSL